MPDGRSIQVRALKPEDRPGWLEYIARTSDASRYQRFFAPKREFSEQEIAFHLNADFVSHVALVAILKEDGREVGVGGARPERRSPMGRRTRCIRGR